MNENRTTQPAPSHGKTHGATLAGSAQAWPTPKARDAKGADGENRNSPGLEVMARGHRGETTPTAGPNGSPAADLNPSFVEALMGLPDGWSDPEGSVTGYTSWVMDWSRRLARGRSVNSSNGASDE